MTQRRPPRHPPPGDTSSAGGNASDAVDQPSFSSAGRSRRSSPPPAPVPDHSRGVLPAQAHLTDRDRTIIDWLDRHGILTTGQITAAFFTSPVTAAHRLAKLRALTLVDRFHRPLPSGGFGPWHWVIGPLGAQITAATRGQPPPTPRALRARHARLADSSHLPHRLGANQFFIDLYVHARHSNGTAQLRRWWSERDSIQGFMGRVHPDGHALWHEGGTTIGLFLEYDTAGAEDLARLVRKLDAYDALARDGGPAYPILFWLHSRAREANLHGALTKRRPGPVPIATGVRDRPGVDPADPVWWLVGDQQSRRRLADLPSRHGRPGSIYNPYSDSP